ncbi:egg protein CP422-like [Leptopilina heterotoma]|uniref:egg protein CP422-like n=1 Tax=Leptopilina heterotoma TaxID=63436 RepID=UPI001CAA00F8|nr:egg protein CP422-like [Leptopilina heterotoma]
MYINAFRDIGDCCSNLQCRGNICRKRCLLPGQHCSGNIPCCPPLVCDRESRLCEHRGDNSFECSLRLCGVNRRCCDGLRCNIDKCERNCRKDGAQCIENNQCCSRICFRGICARRSGL